MTPRQVRERLSGAELYAVLQALMTLALLGFAYLVRLESPAAGDIVVGAAVGHWLRESIYMGQGHRARVQRDAPPGEPGG